MIPSEKHVSNISRSHVETAIKLKISTLTGWANTGIPWLANAQGENLRDMHGELQLDYFPANVSDFCQWDGSQNCEHVRASLSKIVSTNRSTLSSTHSKLKINIEQLCKELKRRALQQMDEVNKGGQIATLKHELTFLQIVVSRQETEITQMQLNTIHLEEKLNQKERALMNGTEHYESTIAALEKQVSELTSSLRKIVPLKVGS